MLNVAAKSEYFSTLGFFGTHRSEPFSAVQDNLCNVCIGFYVVKNCRLAEKALNSGERGTGTRLAALTFDRGHKSGFFAANKCACAKTNIEVEVKSGIENIFAEKAVFTSLFKSNFKSAYCDRVFGTNVDVTLVSADSVTSDSHSFD